jgi:hypothetical protein
MLKFKQLLPYVAWLLFVIWSVTLRSHYHNNAIDPVLQDMYTQKAQYETMLSQQITENKKTEAILQSGRLSEQEYRSHKDSIQNQINAYIHNNTGTAEVFPTNRNVQKLSTTKKMSNPWKGSPSSLSTTQPLKITQMHNLTK